MDIARAKTLRLSGAERRWNMRRLMVVKSYKQDGGSVSPNGGGSGRAGAVSEDCIPCGRRWLCVTGGVMLATVLRVWTVSVPKAGDGVVGCRLSQGQTVEERKPWTPS